jgi:hypothetical protein
MEPEDERRNRAAQVIRQWVVARGLRRLRPDRRVGPSEKATLDEWAEITGDAWPAPLFVAARGASSYTWAEATRDQQMEAWLSGHVHAFEYCKGVPALVVPDNARTGSAACFDTLPSPLSILH